MSPEVHAGITRLHVDYSRLKKSAVRLKKINFGLRLAQIVGLEMTMYGRRPHNCQIIVRNSIFWALKPIGLTSDALCDAAINFRIN